MSRAGRLRLPFVRIVSRGERPRDEIALGLVGKFWKPVIEFVRVTPEQFRDFAAPGYAKTIYALSVRRIDEQRTLLSGVMRTATTDAHARRWFRRYWTFGVGSGAHILVNGLIDVTREMAEARSAGTRFLICLRRSTPKTASLPPRVSGKSRV
jgi:hypothetical protein